MYFLFSSWHIKIFKFYGKHSKSQKVWRRISSTIAIYFPNHRIIYFSFEEETNLNWIHCKILIKDNICLRYNIVTHWSTPKKDTVRLYFQTYMLHTRKNTTKWLWVYGSLQSSGGHPLYSHSFGEFYPKYPRRLNISAFQNQFFLCLPPLPVSN